MASSQTIHIADLLRLAHGGDPRALDRLFSACRNYLNILAKTQVETWLRAKYDASDLVQQTLMEAYRGFPGFKGGTEAEWMAWLRRILEHNAADFARRYGGTDKRQVHKEMAWNGIGDGVSSADGPFNLVDPCETPSQQLMRQERELQIADALATLSDEHREVILLRNLERLPFDEVARRMDRSRPAAQMLWMRALEKLHRALTEMKSLVGE